MNTEKLAEQRIPAVIQTEGDLVAARLPALRSKMRDMAAAGVVNIIVDLTATHMVDSAGIGLLISVHNSLNRAGGALTVTHACKDVLDLFRTMRIHQHFSVSGT